MVNLGPCHKLKHKEWCADAMADCHGRLKEKAHREGKIEMRKTIQEKMRDYVTKLSKKSREDMEFLADVIGDAEDWET